MCQLAIRNFPDCQSARIGRRAMTLILMAAAIVAIYSGIIAAEKSKIVSVADPPAHERLVRKYDVAELLASLARRYQREETELREDLIERLSADEVTVQSGNDSTFMVSASRDQHDRLARILQAWQESGFDQFIANIAIYRVPCSEAESLVDGWSEEDGSTSPTSDRPGNSDEVRPARTKTLTHDAALRRKIREMPGAACLCRRRVVTCNGQPISIAGTTERLFIVKFVKDQNDLQPVHASLSEGMTIDFTPREARNDMIELTAKVSLRDVTDVQLFSLPTKNGTENEDPKKKLPALEQPVSRVSTQLTTTRMASGQTLVICGLTKQNRDGDESARIVTLRLERVRP